MRRSAEVAALAALPSTTLTWATTPSNGAFSRVLSSANSACLSEASAWLTAACAIF